MIVSTENLTKKFEGLVAVDGVNWSVNQGQTKAIIGPNGAGKTTFFNLLFGKLTPTSGRVLFQNEDITDLVTHERVQQGIAKSFQKTSIYDDMTVYDNVRLAVQAKVSVFNMFSRAEDLTEVNDRASKIISRLGLTELENKTVDTLSFGDRRKIELGITLASDPSVLLLDEPTAGMSQGERDEILTIINNISSEDDTTIIITEHDMDVVLNLADEITVLHEGRILSEGEPARIINNEEVQRVYLGEE